MKILHIIDSLGLGGAQTMCENLTGALLRRGHEVVIVSFYTGREMPVARRLMEKGVRIHFLDKKRGFDPSIIGKLKKILKQELPNVVHTHLGAFIYYAAATFGKRKHRWIHTVHSMAQKECSGLRSIVAKHYYRRGIALPVALSERVQESIVEMYGLKKECVPVVFNGVNLAQCFVKETYARKELFVILHVGRLFAVKNHRGLIGAFALFHEKHPDSCLWLLGDGPLEEELKALVAERGLSSYVKFWGHQANVYPFYHDADMLTLTSTVEGIPMTLAEGMGTALPIVATAVGGIPDMLTNEENALLCPVEEEAIARCFARYYENEALREQHGRKALERSRVFSADEMARKYGELYEGRDLV